VPWRNKADAIPGVAYLPKCFIKELNFAFAQTCICLPNYAFFEARKTASNMKQADALLALFDQLFFKSPCK